MDTPKLPMAAIREAMEKDDLEAAMGLISGHERDVRAAVGKTAVTPHNADGWQTLLAEQHALLAQLKAARTEAAEALHKLKGNRRGVQAYRSGGDA